MKEAKVRQSPRISVNKLGEYLVAKAGRRLTIISDQKHPRDFVVARYKAAYEAIAQCLASGKNPRVIRDAVERLYDTTPRSMWHQQDIQLSVDALDLFLNVMDDVVTGDLEVVRADERLPEVNIEGVAVSVRPELILRDAATQATKGAIKLSIVKNNARTEGDDNSGKDSALYVGSILHQYVQEVLAAKTAVSPTDCVVVDVFAQKVYAAPKSFTRRRGDVKAACREIVRGWPDA